MNSIIRFLLLYNQYLQEQINDLLLFIAKFIPLKQWVFDEIHSPKYQKFKTVTDHIQCPHCGAPHEYLYPNNGNKGQYLCKVCGERFCKSNHAEKPLVLKCPYCGNTLEHKKFRLHFKIHKCINKNCS